MDSNLDYKLEGSRAANAWLSEQEVELRKKLEDSELALFQFKNLLVAAPNSLKAHYWQP